MVLFPSLDGASLTPYPHGESESESRSVMSDSLQSRGLYSPRNSSGQNTGVGSLSLLQRIFPTQESNPGFPYCRRILYQLSHKGRPRVLEWVAYPFSRGSSQPRNRTRVCTHKNSPSYNHISVLHTSHNSIQKVGCENGC